MVKLQRTTWINAFIDSEPFPLWHGKVATVAQIRKTLDAFEFPLWHGKVATVMSAGGQF